LKLKIVAKSHFAKYLFDGRGDFTHISRFGKKPVGSGFFTSGAGFGIGVSR
jgi:hypothetical protein